MSGGKIRPSDEVRILCVELRGRQVVKEMLVDWTMEVDGEIKEISDKIFKLKKKL